MSNKFERLMNKAIKTENGACWVWYGVKDKDGYGKIMINKKRYRAHRLSWELNKGPIPTGLCVLHHCDNPECINPDHLFLGTQYDNLKDMRSKNRGVCMFSSNIFGSQCNSAKLTEKEVVDIRSKHLSGQSQNSLSREYKISRAQIWRIIHKVDWKKV